MITLIENEDFRVRFETCVGYPLLHLSVYRFSKSVYQTGKVVVWPLILRQLQICGFSRVYATPFEDDLVAQKLIASFGFKKLNTKNGYVVMCRSTEGG